MSAHAMRDRAHTAAVNVPALLSDPNSIIEPPAQEGMGMRLSGLLQLDILPEQAKSDPSFREGAGSMYAVSQPHLAKKYGVIRNGNHLPPQVLFPQENQRKLSDKTVAGLEEVLKFQKLREKTEGSAEYKAEQDAAKGPAAAAARLGNIPGDENVRPITPEERKEMNEAVIKKLDDFDFDTFRQMMMKDLLNNEEQRQIIEDRLTPMDLGELIVRGSVAQEVTIIPDKFRVTYRSVSAECDLATKRLLMEEAKSVQVDDRYYLDKFALMTLTLGLESINGNPLPRHLDDNGNFNEELFWRKYAYVTHMNIHMIASLGVNYFWYDVRVRKMFVAEKVKNG